MDRCRSRGAVHVSSCCACTTVHELESTQSADKDKLAALTLTLSSLCTLCSIKISKRKPGSYYIAGHRHVGVKLRAPEAIPLGAQACHQILRAYTAVKMP